MSDRQQAAMMVADDSYAGSETFTRLENKVREIFGMEYFLPAHQGRACENILAEAFVKEGSVIPMNFHFTTPKAHITRLGGRVEELVIEEGLKINSDYPFKGNFDTVRLRKLIEEVGADNIPFIRLEAGTNLIGGQPFSLENAREVCGLAKEFGIMTVLDASLLQDNLYFIKTREEACKDMTIKEITRELSDLMDIVYFSARKLGFARGGGICIRSEENLKEMRELIPLFEGFLTYGGMSVREVEAMAVGLIETTDETVISQSPGFIDYTVKELDKLGIPVIMPGGALGVHIDAMQFLPHIPQTEYPAGALAAAFYIVSGCRGMERGTVSSVRDENGNDILSDMELLRLAFPRRVFTLSQTKFVIDRMHWLYKNRDLIGGLKFVDEPKVLRFFVGRLDAVSDWPEKLVAKYKADFGDSL